ncbi:MAG TPA: transcription termination factor NusA [Candidatus Nitrosocosmicus sp.]|nr:transcription termination factor NusA [Candidatus Nitrosocosmicus sp.]
MAVMKSEFFLALNQVATERGISPDDVIESIKQAVLAAFKKDFRTPNKEVTDEEEVETLSVTINEETGETKVFEEGKDITPPGFGRIAAQTARQVILQKIREAEKKTIIKHYVSQVGTIIKGRVIRYDGKNAHFDIGKAEGILPYEEQMRNEQYKLNNAYIVYIKEIKDDAFGNSRIILSRTDTRLVEELFKKEVPEVANATVKIKNVVREPGERAKIAVYSEQSGVDPVGACVGQKGIRVKAVTDELGGEEKIDIIQWNSDDIFFIREALSPASVGNVEIDKEAKRAKVTVDETQAPLAIGHRGTNVNLASKLTGYIIDIVQSPVTPKVETSAESVASEGQSEPAAEESKAPEKENPTETPAEESPTEEVSAIPEIAEETKEVEEEKA